MPYASIEAVQEGLRAHDYIADRSLATALFLALNMQRPLFLEGEAGVGKTEVAKVLATMLGGQLIRLQCYEGLDVNTAVYEWNYARQILQIRMLEAEQGQDRSVIQQEIFGESYLIKRPLLNALEAGTKEVPIVLLIDELDRADEEFEAFLLELLSDFQITIPEIGTIKATIPPHVVITSNRTREIHDALKRRCLYHWVDYPAFEKELAIIRTRVPGLAESLAKQVVAFLHELRTTDLYKQPGVAETIDWSRALMLLGQNELNAEVVDDTLGTLLKYRDDISKVSGSQATTLLEQARVRLADMQH
ncbi:MAG: MoxR family ATPase [Bacteroidota bacterium]